MDKITNINNTEIFVLQEPNIAIVPLRVCNGNISKPIVKLKQIVKRGECIAKANDENSVDIFSPIYGRIIGFDEYPLSNREKGYCVFIENLNKADNTCNANLQAQVLSMKKSLKIDAENKFEFDENKFNQNSNSKNVTMDKSYDLNKMLNSTNAVINFDLEEIELKRNQENLNNVQLDKNQDYNFTPFNDKSDDLLTYINKCGLISHTGNNLVQELKQEKEIVIPCFDCKEYAYENLAILIKYFEEIYEVAKIINEKLNKQIIFIIKKEDKLPDINNVWQGQTDKGIYKLSVDGSNYNKIIKKYFNIIDMTTSKIDYSVLNNHFIVLSPVLMYNLYKALKKGTPYYSTYITIGGKGLQKNGIYKICAGCSLEHIQNCLGGTHSEQDIEDDKMDALDAIGNYLEAKENYKNEKDPKKKAELKTILIKNKKNAKNMANNYAKTVKTKVKSCLGQIVFDDINYGETHGNFQAIFELKNRRIYYLSVSQC